MIDESSRYIESRLKLESVIDYHCPTPMREEVNEIVGSLSPHRLN